VARKERRVAEHGLRPAERLHRKHLDGQHAEHAEEECLEIGRDLGQHGGAENSSSNNPSDGGEHHFYDETRALLASIPAGATVRLQKDVGDLAAFYVIDLIDLEQVPPPLAMPANFLSIVTDCGAIPNDGLNDEPAIRTCIANAKAQGTGVWIPAGTFENTTQAFSVSDVTIRGAGMWYSTIHGPHASFHCAGNNCRFYDFSVFGESVTRQIVLDEFGFLGKAGTGSRLENIWVEHTQVGYWVGSNDSTKPVTDGLVITGARIRNTFADGVNFCNGTSNSEVVNSHFRNTGDDAVASWSPRSDSTNVGNMIHFNTVQIPWRANCYAIYGGRDNKIEDNLCYDVVTYPGIMVAQDFESNAFAGVTSVQRNTLIRAGGPMWGVEQGALKVWAPDASVLGLVVNEIDMDGSTFSGIQFEGPQNVIDATFSNVTIANAGTWGIHLRPDAHGDATFTNVAVSNPASGGLLNEGSNFVITRGTGNSGW